MFYLTKKHLSRRALLRGAGAVLALPLLESMIPAGVARAAIPAATPRARLACVYVPHGAVMSHRGNHLDLDPTYRDVYGRPLLRMTFDFTDNEHRMSDYLTDRAVDIARAMKPRELAINKRQGSWDVVPYQTTHNTGGAIMGSDPKTSALNKYLQSWDVSNLFVMGASAFPQNPGYNPTGTVAALAYHSAAAITQRWLKAPGALA